MRHHIIPLLRIFKSNRCEYELQSIRSIADMMQPIVYLIVIDMVVMIIYRIFIVK